MTEQQKYAVLRQYRGFELRHYAACVLAEVQVSGSFESAGNTAFRPLASYIGGRNSDGRTISMTAPVIQEPVAGHQHEVSFVMPAGSEIDSLPSPAASDVRLRTVPEETVAAARFSGRWTKRSFEQQAVALAAALREAGLTQTGPPRFARYDPPWTPFFLRRNEVLIPVAG